jgi:hypothetical protein
MLFITASPSLINRAPCPRYARTRFGYTNVENDSCGGINLGREPHERATDLDGERIELAEAIGWWSVNGIHPNLLRSALCKHRLATREGQENASEVIVVLGPHKN